MVIGKEKVSSLKISWVLTTYKLSISDLVILSSFSLSVSEIVEELLRAKLKEIGSLTLDFPFFLAPMAGVTDYAYRVIAKEFGAGIVYSEFVSAHGIIRKNEKTLKMIEFSNFERPIGIQIFGDTPIFLEKYPICH